MRSCILVYCDGSRQVVTTVFYRKLHAKLVSASCDHDNNQKKRKKNFYSPKDRRNDERERDILWGGTHKKIPLDLARFREGNEVCGSFPHCRHPLVIWWAYCKPSLSPLFPTRSNQKVRKRDYSWFGIEPPWMFKYKRKRW